MNPQFAPLDWLVVGLYVLVLLIGGWLFSRFKADDARDYFLAGRTVPAQVWPVIDAHPPAERIAAIQAEAAHDDPARAGAARAALALRPTR